MSVSAIRDCIAFVAQVRDFDVSLFACASGIVLLFRTHFANSPARSLVSSRNFKVFRHDGYSVYVVSVSRRAVALLKAFCMFFIIVSEGISFPIRIRVLELVAGVGF